MNKLNLKYTRNKLAKLKRKVSKQVKKNNIDYSLMLNYKELNETLQDTIYKLEDTIDEINSKKRT